MERGGGAVRRVRVMAFGKVNLCLEVLGKRQDGFHEVRTVMQSIGLADEVVLEEAETLSVESDLPELAGEDNLALRAARALVEQTHYPSGVRIGLRKGIPVAAGMGGASADAAATLVGLTLLWRLAIGPPELFSIASAIGSDVPFFLTGGTALATGRGERITPLPDLVPTWLVVLVPSHSLVAKTAELYRRLKPQLWSGGERTDRLADAIRRRERPATPLLTNCFEPVAEEVFPRLGDYRDALLSAGADSVHLSGAGPALFGLFESEAAAGMVAGTLAGRGFSPLVTRTLPAVDARPQPQPAS